MPRYILLNHHRTIRQGEVQEQAVFFLSTHESSTGFMPLPPLYVSHLPPLLFITIATTCALHLTSIIASCPPSPSPQYVLSLPRPIRQDKVQDQIVFFFCTHECSTPFSSR
jgi:hypothetical protein